MRLHGGFKKAGRLGILHSGLKPLPVAWNPKDIAYEKGMQETMKKIFGIFGVPPAKATNDANRANAQAANITYMTDTIMPLAISYADMLNQNIMPCYDEKLFIAPDDAIPQDKDFNLKEQAQRIESGTWSRNHLRLLDGLDEVEGGDELLVSSSLKPLSQVLKEPEPIPQFTTDSDAEGDSDIKGIIKGLGLGCSCKKHTRHKQDGLDATVDAVEVTDIENDLDKSALAWFAAMAVIASPSINQFTVSSWEFLDNEIPWHEIQTSGVANLGPPMVRSLNAGVRAANIIAPQTVSVIPSVPVNTALDFARKHAAGRVTFMLDSTKEGLRQSIVEQLTSGNTHVTIAKNLRKQIGMDKVQMGAFEKFKATTPAPSQAELDIFVKDKIRIRSSRIARTETSTAFNEGQRETYRQMDIKFMKWTGADDACEICAPFVGRIYKVSTVETLPKHPNCRCSWVPVENKV